MGREGWLGKARVGAFGTYRLFVVGRDDEGIGCPRVISPTSAFITKE